MDSTKNKTFVEKIKNWLLTVPISAFTFGSIILALLIIIVGGGLLKIFFPKPSAWMLFGLGSLFLLIMGSSGVLGIFRKEASTKSLKKSIRGGWGVFWSALWTATFYIPLLIVLVIWIFRLY